MSSELLAENLADPWFLIRGGLWVILWTIVIWSLMGVLVATGLRLYERRGVGLRTLLLLTALIAHCLN
jgi:hypothetical protein